MIEAGDLLVAPPLMTDSRFSETVILVANHSAAGSNGFAVNKVSGYTINDILPEVGLEANLPFPLYWGGPVKTSGIWLLHDPDWYTENTMMINDHWSVTSSLEMFYNFADGDLPRHFRFVHGMSGWAPGQLEMEMKGDHYWKNSSSWITVSDTTPEWCFEHNLDTMWESATELAAKSAVATWL